MATETFDTAVGTRIHARKYNFPWISWGAIFGGLASGMAFFLLLAMLGLAAGFTALEPRSAEPVGSVTMATGIWTGISMLIAAFVGGYVAARISGLSRRTDGILHGFVVWGASTLLFAYLVTTSAGALMGGVFNLIGQGVQATAGVVSGAAGEGQLQNLISGSAGQVQITPDAMASLQDRLAAGDRQGAVSVMVTQMGISPEIANSVADQAMAVVSTVQQLPSGQQAASAAVAGLTTAFWWLFVALLLSLLLGLAGGATGAKGVMKRRTVMAH